MKEFKNEVIKATVCEAPKIELQAHTARLCDKQGVTQEK